MSITAAVLQFSNDAAYEQTRSLLERIDFTESGVTRLLGTDRIYIPKAIDAKMWSRRATGKSPLEILTRLIVIGQPSPRDDVRTLLGDYLLEAWMSAGLIERQGDLVLPLINITPYHGLWIISDRPRVDGGPPRDNFVMGFGGSTRTLLNVMRRTPVPRTLDLGTGCGVLALMAAGHSEHVVAVDLNPRAIEMVRFNAALNGIKNVEARVGNLFEPVAGEKFDQVLSNPPFVVSPSDGPMYRDGRMSGDQFCENLFRQLPDYLQADAFAHVLCNWVHPVGTDWEGRLRHWFAASQCDVWIMHSEEVAPDTYAALWIRQSGYIDSPESAALFERWMCYYDDLGIEAISMGLATLRRRTSAENWFRILRTPDRMTGPCSADVERFFCVTDFLIDHDDSQLVRRKFKIAADVQMQQTCAPGDGGWNVKTASIKRTEGIGFTGEADPFIASILVRCDGARTLASIIEAVCEEWGLEPGEVAANVLRVFRYLLERGFVAPAD